MKKYEVTGFIYIDSSLVGSAVHYILDTFKVSQINKIEKREGETAIDFTFTFIAENSDDVETFAIDPMKKLFDVDNYVILEVEAC